MSKETEKADEIDRGIHKEIREKRTGVRKFMADLLNMHDGMMSYEEIDEMMLENTVIHGPNMWILCLAALIASIGLNMNSTAVIIGAMLISPLMSGIMTMGYSLAVRDLRLLRRALLRFGTQVVISLISSTVYFLITPIDTPTAEMIARTSPTIWDVLIALFGGIAGAIGNTREKKGNVIPGVAIATALMPPLCTAGYGIASGQPSFFLGAFYLFLINTLFISLSTMIVTMMLRVPYHRNVSDKKQKVINRAVAAQLQFLQAHSEFRKPLQAALRQQSLIGGNAAGRGILDVQGIYQRQNRDDLRHDIGCAGGRRRGDHLLL